MTTLETRPLEGTLRFIRYAFMPNRLRYCAGDDNRTLFEYGVEGVSDGGLQPLLRKFSGALPYLQLIAHANGLRDPFDARVVEAYWIGNELLDGVEARQLYASLKERFASQLTQRTREVILGKAPAGAHPHHSFYVLDVWSRVGELDTTLGVLDNCRIGWGRVRSVAGVELVVERQPLVLTEGKLRLGEPRTQALARQVDGHGFVDQAKHGDWVTTHWGWACEVLGERGRRNLERYTRHHLRIANETL
jgi:hydrogenase maturation factor